MAAYLSFEPLCTFSVLSQRDAASGSAVTATISEAITAMEMVSARSANSCDTASRMNTMGRKTMTAVTVVASSAGHTCFAPASVASMRAEPSLALLRDGLEHDDGRVERLADAEGEARERDHVERAPERVEHHQRDGEADRDRQAD